MDQWRLGEDEEGTREKGEEGVQHQQPKGEGGRRKQALSAVRTSTSRETCTLVLVGGPGTGVGCCLLPLHLHPSFRGKGSEADWLRSVGSWPEPLCYCRPLILIAGAINPTSPHLIVCQPVIRALPSSFPAGFCRQPRFYPYSSTSAIDRAPASALRPESV